MDRIPVNLKEGIFRKLFETAEIAKLDPEEFTAYQASLNAYRDMKNTIDTAWEEGKTEGKTEGKIEGKTEVAKNLLKNGVSMEIIIASTGLSKEEIENLKKEIGN